MSTKSSARIKKRRAGEPWVSNNRVLTGNAASKKGGTLGRNPNFDTDETKLLIQLWGDPKVQRTLITTHKKHAVICQLATKMQEYGYYRSPEEITTRIKNLKCFYNRLKKDMETENVQQQTAEPTWKHFTEMDAIMTRPIFSVRPNEVPAPSLKYQLEQAKEERQERRRKILEEGGTLSESDDDSMDGGGFSKAKQEIDDGIIPDVEVDIDISDETFVAIANAAEKSEKTVKKRKISKNSESSLGDASDYEGEPNVNANDDLTSDEEKELKIKEENDSNDNDSSSEAALLLTLANRGEAKAKPDTTVTTTLAAGSIKTTKDKEGVLVLPKEEPIDVDAEYEAYDKTGIQTNVKSLMPTLADILQMSKTNLAISSSGMVMPTCTTTIAGVPANYVTAASSTHTMNTISPIATTGPQGKISLVPTNFLMQPKTATVTNTNSGILPVQPTHPIHLLQNTITPQMQQRLLLSGGGPQVSSAQATPNKTGIVTTGPGGMKVLLVNAEQSGANTGLAQQITAANCMGKTLSMPLNNATALIQQQQQQQQLQQLQQQLQQQQLQQQQNLNQQKQQLQQQKEALQQQQQHHEQEQKMKRQEREKKREELMSKKDATGMRILLRQLLNAQTENNEIQHQRLSMERERLDFEKSMAERFLTAFPAFFAQQQQQSAAAAATAQLRLNPPKLVFTTATAMSQAAPISTILTTPSATTLTSLPKVAANPKPIEICTQINDIQLLTPKLETETD